MWYKNEAMGVHSLGNIMKKMAEKGKLTGRKTNHSGRKTTVKRLRDANIEAIDIMKITGHKNIASINSYSELPGERHKKISKVLTSKKQITVESSESAQQNQPPIESSLDVESGDFDIGPTNQVTQQEQMQPIASPEAVSTRQANHNLDFFEDFNFDEAQWTELFRQTEAKPTFNNCTFNKCTFKM